MWILWILKLCCSHWVDFGWFRNLIEGFILDHNHICLSLELIKESREVYSSVAAPFFPLHLLSILHDVFVFNLLGI
jgi:hypothetical protein